MKRPILLAMLVLLIISSVVTALDFDPRGNIVGRNKWNITDFFRITFSNATWNTTPNCKEFETDSNGNIICVTDDSISGGVNSWVYDGTDFTPNASDYNITVLTGAFRIPSLISCNTIDTTINGTLICGSDETGTGGGSVVGVHDQDLNTTSSPSFNNTYLTGNLTVNGSIVSNNWTNITITESQITDLSHTVNTDTQGVLYNGVNHTLNTTENINFTGNTGKIQILSNLTADYVEAFLNCDKIKGATSNLCTLTDTDTQIVSWLYDGFAFTTNTSANVRVDQNLNISGDVNITGSANASSFHSDNYLNSSGSREWINPEDIFDVDDEDIESDLNTYWDIAGDNIAGNITVSANKTWSFGNESQLGWIDQIFADLITGVKIVGNLALSTGYLFSSLDFTGTTGMSDLVDNDTVAMNYDGAVFCFNDSSDCNINFSSESGYVKTNSTSTANNFVATGDDSLQVPLNGISYCPSGLCTGSSQSGFGFYTVGIIGERHWITGDNYLNFSLAELKHKADIHAGDDLIFDDQLQDDTGNAILTWNGTCTILKSSTSQLELCD